MSGSMGCGGLGVSGQGGDSVIRLSEDILQSVNFAGANEITQNITESVTIQVS